MFTASANGALVHAYTRLPALSAAVTASASLANGFACVPSPPGGAFAWANTPQASVTFFALGSPAQAGLPPSPCRQFKVPSGQQVRARTQSLVGSNQSTHPAAHSAPAVMPIETTPATRIV